MVVASGGGYHAYWLFREAIGASENRIQVEAALRQLADLVGGDLAVCEIARIMRLPGSHNTKSGGWAEVKVVHHSHARYELADLQEWLSETSPVIERKPRNSGSTNGAGLNPFLEAAKRFGHKPPIDVEQRLAAMTYQGSGETAIHTTQLSVSAALLNRGTSIDDVVAILMAATKTAAGPLGAGWDWAREERAIRQMCESWVVEHPQAIEAGARRSSEARPNHSAFENQSSGSTAVVALAEERAKRQPKPRTAKEGDPIHIVLGKSVLAVIKKRGGDLLFNAEGSWRYQDGRWCLDFSIRGWLDVQIETACQALGVSSTIKVVNETRNWITRNPDLWRDDVPWDQHGKVPVRNGLVDPITRTLEEARPDHFLYLAHRCGLRSRGRLPLVGVDAQRHVRGSQSRGARTNHQSDPGNCGRRAG